MPPHMRPHHPPGGNRRPIQDDITNHIRVSFNETQAYARNKEKDYIGENSKDRLLAGLEEMQVLKTRNKNIWSLIL